MALTLRSLAHYIASAFSRGQVAARFDSAQTTHENRRHWANADALAAVSALTPGVRRTLRIRSRYEHENNCYMRGAVSSIVSDVVGSGPRPQVLTDSKALNSTVEKAWKRWAVACNLPDKLRVLDTAKRVDGEGFGVLQTNRLLLDLQPVALDVRLVEAEQVADPTGWNQFAKPNADDGLETDAAGNPTRYSILRAHPGDNRGLPGQLQADWVDAGQVLHWFRPTRPGQLRGYAEMAAALPLFAQLRRFTLAVLGSAEMAAMIAGVLQTQSGVTIPEFKSAKNFEQLEFARNMLLTLPAGYSVSQLKAEQPTTLYEMFVNVLLREIGRVLDMPFGIIAGDSSKYNYSSARLDHQTYDLRRDAERDQLILRVLARVFRAWLREAAMAYDRYDPVWRTLGVVEEVPVTWHFPARQSIDPLKEASADDVQLKNYTTTLAEIYAAKGQDWEEQLQQRAKEKKRMTELGLFDEALHPATQAAVDEEKAGKEVANAA